MAEGTKCWWATVEVVLLIGVGCTVAFECVGDALRDPATALACQYLPPGVYRPATVNTPIASNASLLCSSDTACPNLQCFYCPYCRPVTAVCACYSSGSAAPLERTYAILNFTTSYAIENFTPPDSGILGRCAFTKACPAEANYSAANCSAVPPVNLTAASPSTGPISGGTLLLLSGGGMTSVTGVRVGSSACDVASFRSWQTDGVVYCLLAGGQKAGDALNVTYTVAGRGTPIVSQLLFTYSADPVVLDLSPREVVVSQSHLVVRGINLAAADRSFLVSRLFATNTTQTYYAPCSASSLGSLLSCECPTGGVDGNDTEYDMYVYADGFRNTSLVRNASNTWSIPFTVYPDPVVNTFPSVGLLHIFDPAYGADNSGLNITLTGSGLSFVDASRYVIEIGNDTWCRVLDLSYDTLTCTPSSLKAPGLGDNYTTYLGQSAPSMTVLINDTDYVQFVGYVMFYNYRNAYIIIGVTFGTLGLTAIIIVIVLVLYAMQRRSVKRKRLDAYQTKESHGVGTNSRM